MSVYFVRHGESEANVEKVFSSPDTPLTDKGRAQATQLGIEVRSLNIGLLLSSPDVRAVDSASIIANQIGYEQEITIVDELHERRFGSLAGTPRKSERYYAYLFNEDGDAETQTDLINRMKKVLDRIRTYADQTQGNILIVGHTVSGFYLREVASGKTQFKDFSDSYHIDNATITELMI